MAKRKLKVLILGGGPSSEHEISLKTAEMVHKNLDRKRYQPVLATITKKGEWLLPGWAQNYKLPKAPVLQDLAQSDGTSRAIRQQANTRVLAKLGVEAKKRADIAFIAMHGEFGEDGKIQAILETAGIPYTGSGVLASALGMDKLRSQAIFASQGLNVPKIFDLKSKLPFPIVIKPSDRGSSVGVSIVRSKKDLSLAIKKALSFSKNIMAQEFIAGTELTCGVLDDGKNNLMPLLPTEIVPKMGEFFDYESKYRESGSDEITPARAPHEIIKEAQNIALKAHALVGCSGFSRTDMIWSRDRAKVYILEINTIPGLTAQSLLPKAALASGISFPRLLDYIIQAALAKQS